MESGPSGETKNGVQQPEAETLKERSASDITPDTAGITAPKAETPKKSRLSYRPSHRATFIGLAAVVAILAINAIVIGLVLKNESNTANSQLQGQVTVDQSALEKLGVNRGTVGDS